MNCADVPRPEPAEEWRTPSQYQRCRARRGACRRPPVADCNRGRYDYKRHRKVASWWAYCAEDLAAYNREVRADGRVWWRGCSRHHLRPVRLLLVPAGTPFNVDIDLGGVA